MHTAPPPAALVFDLDGTLSDPACGIGRSINHALVAFGFAPIAAADVPQYIGPPLDASFRALTGSNAPDLIHGLVAKYRERYADVGYAENALYPGIPAALATLAGRGHVLGVCTTKRADFAEQILALFGLRGFFAFVSGGEIGVHKDRQLRDLRTRGAIGAGSVMVGDRAFDVHAAKANGLRAVGVLWGHGSQDELAAAGADVLLDAVPQLVNL